jgi:hypothetical protein
MTTHPFRTAVEARDLDALAALLDENVVFNSPIVFRPYAGRDATIMVLAAVIQVFEEFVYDAELASEDGRTHALMFRARVGDKALEGCDFLHHGKDGHVDELTVMVRPFSAAVALRERMAALLAATR